jgi:hypothetical protein
MSPRAWNRQARPVASMSEAVMSRVKSLFDFDDRGTVEVKNKGQLRMLYLMRIKPELSRDDAGHMPNDAFHRESAKLFPGYVAAA